MGTPGGGDTITAPPGRTVSVTSATAPTGVAWQTISVVRACGSAAAISISAGLPSHFDTCRNSINGEPRGLLLRLLGRFVETEGLGKRTADIPIEGERDEPRRFDVLTVRDERIRIGRFHHQDAAGEPDRIRHAKAATEQKVLAVE